MGVSESDVYQVLAYSRAYSAKRLILVYPWHQEMDAEQGVVRRWSVTESYCLRDVVTVDVGRPGEVLNVLQGIYEYGSVRHRADLYSLRGFPNAAAPQEVIGQ